MQLKPFSESLKYSTDKKHENMKIYGLIWDKNLIVKNDSKLGGIGVLARPGNTNMGGSD